MSYKTQHTPEPWACNESINTTVDVIEITAENDFKTIAKIQAYEFFHCSIPETNANAARIVACVNACAGINEPAEHIKRLEELYDDLHAVQDEARKTQKQRDELLQALQNLENDDNSIPEHAWALVQQAINNATKSPTI